MLEFKNPNEDWPAEKNIISIYVSRYDAGLNDFDTPTNIKVDADLSLNGLRAAFETAYGPKFPKELMCIINCTGGHMFLYEEEYNEKIIERELGIHDHSLLYIETLAHDGAESAALKRLIEQQNSFELFYNLIGQDTSSKQISMAKSKTIRELKEAIAKQIDLPVQQFRMLERRLRSTFKNENQTLQESGLYDCAQLFLEEGTPMTETEHYIKLYVHIPFDEQSAAELMEEDVEKPLDWSVPYVRKPADLSTATLPMSTTPVTPDQTTWPDTADHPDQEDDLVENAVVVLSAEDAQTAINATNPTDSPRTPTNNPITSTETTTTTTTATANPTSTMEDSSQSLILALMRKKKEFKLLGKVALEENMKLIDFKTKIAAHLGLPSANHVRLRTKMGTMFLTLMTQDDCTMKENCPSLMDGKQFVVQMLKQPEVLVKGDILINVQRWYPSQWKLGKKVEVVVNEEKRFKSTEELKKAIAAVHDEALESLEFMSLTKCPGSFEFWSQKECADVVLFTWDLESDNVFAKPFGLRDGEYMLFKDSREAEKIPIDQLKTLLNKEGQSEIVYHGKQQAREQQLRIYTEFDDLPSEKKNEVQSQDTNK